MRLEHTLYGADKSHIEFIDVSSLNRHKYTRHMLLVSAGGKGKLVQLIADKVKCRTEPGKILL
jgi:hypothetical protein